MTPSPVRFERRAGQRFEFHLPVAVKLAGSGKEGLGFTQDISARGAFFYSDVLVQAGDSIELTLVMPSEITLGENMRVRCRGRVMRVVTPAAGEKLGGAASLQGYEYLPEAEAARATASFERISALHDHAGAEEETWVRVPSRV
jgi:hypothetical protein